MERQARPVKVILHIKKEKYDIHSFANWWNAPPTMGWLYFLGGNQKCRIVWDNYVALAAEGVSQRTINRVQTQNVIILASEFPLDNALFRGSWTKLFVGGSWNMIMRTNWTNNLHSYKRKLRKFAGERKFGCVKEIPKYVFLAETISLWVFQNLHRQKTIKGQVNVSGCNIFISTEKGKGGLL